MVVEVAVISVGLLQAQQEGEVVRREREAPGAGVCSPPSIPLYIGGLGDADPLEIGSPRAGAPPQGPHIKMGGGGLGTPGPGRSPSLYHNSASP